MSDISYLIVYPCLILGMYLSVKLKKLTIAGALTGGLIGSTIFLGTGIFGLLLLATFFISGTWVSGHKAKLKSIDSQTYLMESKRTAGQVFANGGCAAIFSLLAYFDKENSSLYFVMMAASFAAATSDTFSSELGTVYGKRFYNCISFKPDLKGENGVISLEGIFFGIIGATFIALIYVFFKGDFYNMFLVIVAGLFGNISDSVLGATLERRHYISNNFVNFISCALAALAICFFI